MPTQTIRTVCSLICGLIRIFLFPSIYSALVQDYTQLSRLLYGVWPLTADSSQQLQRRHTNRRSPRSRQGRPHSRSRRHKATVWRCICFSSRQTDSTSMRNLQRGRGKKMTGSGKSIGFKKKMSKYLKNGQQDSVALGRNTPPLPHPSSAWSEYI